MAKVLPDKIFDSPDIQLGLEAYKLTIASIAAHDPEDVEDTMKAIHDNKDVLLALMHKCFIAGMKYKGKFGDDE